ncbi:peptidoglycan-binding protein [Streptomyces alboflavus]|uniref:Peptidoglycan-binding protein n=1 Tax=Streptomyces alboflavus TaxID=67267 RepID=A0A1Z1WD15_9ACTN|nr:peptidoglycan-binding protein [Streptomyces alboflavus]
MVIILIAVVALGGAGMGAATLIKSPQQAAVETAAPPRDVLTAAVEHRVLAQSVVARGTVTASQNVDVSPAEAAGQGASRALYTKVKVHEGTEVRFGQVLLEVSGRPVFALPGEIPAYRDLGPGTHGEDVTQLQRALSSLGRPVAPDRPGAFGPGTARAVRGLYRLLGYEPNSASTPQNAPDGTRGEEKAEEGRGRPGPGPVVAAAEVVYLKSTPARVERVKAKVGQEAGEAALTLSAGERIIKAGVAPHEKGLIRPGQKATLLSEATGQRATAEVVSVAQSPVTAKGEGEASTGSFTVRLRPDAPLPTKFATDVRVQIAAASSPGKVLAVPASAISAGADSRTTVTVESTGEPHRVEVRTGMSADGFVQVTPVGRAALSAGDRVVVGVEGGGQDAPGH